VSIVGCSGRRYRLRYWGDPLAGMYPKPAVCSVDGCDSPVPAPGLWWPGFSAMVEGARGPAPDLGGRPGSPHQELLALGRQGVVSALAQTSECEDKANFRG
jgi:hypothetical protein